MPSAVPADDRSTPKLINITVNDRISEANAAFSILRYGITHYGMHFSSMGYIRLRTSVLNFERIFMPDAEILTLFALLMLLRSIR